MKLFISAGEPSGDLHAAQVIREIKRLSPESEIAFLGGDLMAREAATQPLAHYRDMSFMGFTEVISHLPTILRNLSAAKKAIAEMRPDAVLLVDYPGFNMKLAAYAHSLGIPVYYYIAPKVWAWKEYRVKALKKYVDRIFSILPFEPQWFGERGLGIEYVGNPSVEEVDSSLAAVPSRTDFFAETGISDDKPLLLLVPGSRRSEIKYNLPVMDAVAHRHPEVNPIIAGAPEIDGNLYGKYSRLPVVYGHTLELMSFARAALVTSGTASLECALAGTPQVVCYRSIGWKPAHDLFKHILKIPYVSLPNLIAGSIDTETRRQQNREGAVRGFIIPEMLVHHCNVYEVDAQLSPLLQQTVERERQLDGYSKMRARLSSTQSAALNVASRILNLTNVEH